jgi:hypothetical protein
MIIVENVIRGTLMKVVQVVVGERLFLGTSIMFI